MLESKIIKFVGYSQGKEFLIIEPKVCYANLFDVNDFSLKDFVYDLVMELVITGEIMSDYERGYFCDEKKKEMLDKSAKGEIEKQTFLVAFFEGDFEIYDA